MSVDVYRYDEKTKIYVGKTPARIDTEETRLQEKVVYTKPKNGTYIKPPEHSENKIPVFDEKLQKWSLINNFVGSFQINLQSKVISKVDYFGDIKPGYQILSEDIVSDYQQNPEKYDVINNKLVNISLAVDSSDSQAIILAKTSYKKAEILIKYNALVDLNTQKYNSAMNTKIELNGKFLKPMFIQKWTSIYTDGLDDISLGIDNPKCNYSWYETNEESSYKLFENIDYKTTFLNDFRALKPITKYVETKYQKYLDFILSMYGEIDNFSLENYNTILQKISDLSNQLDYSYSKNEV